MAKKIGITHKSTVEESAAPAHAGLDEKDRALVLHLCRNYRLTYSMLAKLLGMSREAVKYRVKRLHARGVLIRPSILVNPLEMGFGCHPLFLKFGKAWPEKEERFFSWLAKHEAVQWVAKTSGRWDAVIWLVARNRIELNALVTEIRERCSDFLRDFEAVCTLYEYKYTPLCTGVLQGAEFREPHFRKDDASFGKTLHDFALAELEPYRENEVKLEALDLRIFGMLDNDLRVPLGRVGRELGISAENVRYRLRRAIKKKMLSGFWGRASMSALGLQWYLLMLRVRHFSAEKEGEFKRFVKNHEFIVWANRTDGPWDIGIQVNARNLEHFSQVISEIRSKFGDIIIDYDSAVVLKEYKYAHFCRVFYRNAEGNKGATAKA